VVIAQGGDVINPAICTSVGEPSVRCPRVVRRGGPMGWSWTRPRMTRARRVQVTSFPSSRWGSRVPSRMSRWIRWPAMACRTSCWWGVSGLRLSGWIGFRGPLTGGVDSSRCNPKSRSRRWWIVAGRGCRRVCGSLMGGSLLTGPCGRWGVGLARLGCRVGLVAV